MSAISWSLNWYGIFEHTKAVDASGCTWSSVNSSTMTKTGNAADPEDQDHRHPRHDHRAERLDGRPCQLDATNAPCSTESFTYLAGKHFFDNTKCHRLVDQDDYILQCGDPTGTGTGGPSYQYAG